MSVRLRQKIRYLVTIDCTNLVSADCDDHPAQMQTQREHSLPGLKLNYNWIPQKFFIWWWIFNLRCCTTLVYIILKCNLIKGMIFPLVTTFTSCWDLINLF